MPDLLSAVEIEASLPVKSSVIWLHGLGADGNDFVPIVPELGLSDDLGVRFVFPHAPRIPVTLNGGLIMPAWYDIRDADLDFRHDLDGMKRSAEQVEVLIRREMDRGVRSEKIVLAGFSQGGSVALHLGLRLPDPLAGILALSAYLAQGDAWEDEASEANSRTPIFQAHGLYDPMVSVKRGEEARDRLTRKGYQVSWHTYPMVHQVCMEEVREIGAWLGSVLGD
jgi:phospholipase/carboxylesterase